MMVICNWKTVLACCGFCRHEFAEEYAGDWKGDDTEHDSVTLLQGVLAHPLICRNGIEQIEKKYPKIKIHVYAITQ